MTEHADRLAFLLAASGLSEKVLQASLTEAEIVGASEMINRIQAIRRTFMEQIDTLSTQESDVYESREDFESDRLAKRIIQLLQIEARLSPAIAAARLHDSLIMDKKSARELPPFRTKDGLRNWLKRISHEIPPSELLHHATKVRNSIIHPAPIDWPLRDRDK